MSELPEDLKRTAFYNLHKKHDAKLVPFAGYEMPVQYDLGVKKEHLHTRDQAGLFDVSHMGQLKLTGSQAAVLLEELVPVDIIDLPTGKQRYAFFTNDEGGVLDDLMVSNYGNFLYVVVNAACKEADIVHMKNHFAGRVDVEIMDSHALLALQGPKAGEVMARLAPEVADMVFMDTRPMTINGIECFISRSGYTGEDGFEISVSNNDAEAFATALLEQQEVEWIGLGARDSLRLESGLCLYGNDIDTTTTPVEAGLLWGISKTRRSGGKREGNFPGAETILEQIARKQVSRKRVGLKGLGRAPVREGTEIVNAQGDVVGTTCSGTYGPTIEAPVAMAYLKPEYSALDIEVYAIVRGKQLAMTVTRMPFVTQRYYRGEGRG